MYDYVCVYNIYIYYIITSQISVDEISISGLMACLMAVSQLLKDHDHLCPQGSMGGRCRHEATSVRGGL